MTWTASNVKLAIVPTDAAACRETVARTSMIVVVCTYRRNGPLKVLLDAVIECAEQVRPKAAVGVVVVDDNPDGAARPVVEEFEGKFELGAHYRKLGKGNLSLARNLCLETGIGLGEWIVLTDDDCEPPPQWLAAHLAAQQKTDCDATTGAMVLRAPPGAPLWLVEQPFYDDYELHAEHLQRLEATGTNNFMLRSAWLRANPDIRFLEQFGRSGGEDWIFCRMARKTGFVLRFSSEAFVVAHEPPERTTLKYQLRNRLWLGNNEFFINVFTKESPRWLLILMAWERLPRSLVFFLGQLPRPHYAAVIVARSLGYLMATFGVRLNHH
jgi:succinoglycan biosynthesis protein ExoM